MTPPSRAVRLGSCVIGVLLLLLGSLLYAEVIGLANFGLLDGGGLQTMARRFVLGGALLAAVAVFVAVARWRGRFRSALERWPRGVQGLVAALLGLTLTTPYVPLGPQVWLVVPFAIGAVGFGLLVFGLGAPALRRVSRASAFASKWVLARPGWVFVAGVSLLVLGLGATLSTVLFDRTPHVVDGVAYLFQARIFESGALFLPSHPLPEFFHLDTTVNNGRWFAQYTPGHTLVLLIGVLASAPWLVNPVLGALTVVALYALGKQLFDVPTTRLAVVLLPLSPFIVLMSSEFYSHSTALLFCTLFLLFYARFVEAGRVRDAVLAGAVLGFCAVTRPLTAVAFSVPVFIDALLRLRRGELRGRDQVRGMVLGGGVLALLVALLLAYNHMTSGDALIFGYAVADGPGFGPRGFTPFIRTLDRLRLLNDALFAWPIPSLALVLVAFLGGKPSRWDYLMVGVFASFLIFHAPVAYRDAEFGPRYLYESAGLLVLLTARGIMRSGEAVRRFSIRLGEHEARGLVGGGVVLCFLAAAAFHWFPHVAFYGSPEWRWAVHTDAVDAARAAELTDAIVFVEEPAAPFPRRWWNVAFLQNAVPLEASPVIFARDLGDRNVDLLEFHPTRRGYVARGRTLLPLHRE